MKSFKKNLNLRKSSCITTSLGIYHRAVETPDFIFYVNFEESDDNASVKMYDRSMKLVSDNYFANQALFEELDKKGKKNEITWKSKKMIEMLELSK